MLRIYYMKFDASISCQQKDLYIQYLSDARRRRVQRIKSSQAALECMQTGLFLRYGLEQLDEKDLYQKVSIGDNGKPYIENSNISFNLSHSGDFVVLMIADCVCGIDIQKLVKNQDRLAKRIMHRDEYIQYASLQEEQQRDYISWCWSAKEAYLKYTGDGIRYAMSNINMFDFLQNSSVYEMHQLGEMSALCNQVTMNTYKPYMLRFHLYSEYFGTICIEHPCCVNFVKAVTIEEVFSHFNSK